MKENPERHDQANISHIAWRFGVSCHTFALA